MRDCIVLLGRAGLEYHDEQGIKYFVDSELCMGDEYDYPLGRGINFSIAVEDVEGIYKLVKTLKFEIYRELTRNQYQVTGAVETQMEFLIQDPNGYLLRFTN